MSENTNAPAVANLAQARKEQAAARKAVKAAHPAGTAKAPAKKAPARKAPAKAAAKAPTGRKTPAQSGRQKLRWAKTGTGLVATTDDVTYGIVKSGEKFKGTVKKDGETVTVIDGVAEGRAYAVLTALHHYDRMPDGKKAVAS